jgi:carbonic anhydrase/acetyltransferase-like protein (isoleucine patch superfamily)
MKFNKIKLALGLVLAIPAIASAAADQEKAIADSNNWAAPRGDYSNQAYSKLSQINQSNVKNLKAAWTFATGVNRGHEGSPLVIGDDVTVGHHVTLHGCTIGNRVLIGINTVVLDDVIIEDDVMIGAGSLVPPRKVLKSGYLYVGSPVQQVRPLTDKEKAFLPYSAQNYVKVKNDYKQN